MIHGHPGIQSNDGTLSNSKFIIPTLVDMEVRTSGNLS